MSKSACCLVVASPTQVGIFLLLLASSQTNLIPTQGDSRFAIPLLETTRISVVKPVKCHTHIWMHNASRHDHSRNKFHCYPSWHIHCSTWGSLMILFTAGKEGSALTMRKKKKIHKLPSCLVFGKKKNLRRAIGYNSSRPFPANPGKVSLSRIRAAPISTSPQTLKHSLVELWDSGSLWKIVSRAESSSGLICSAALRRKIVMVTRSNEWWGIREIMEIIQAQERGRGGSAYRITLSKEILRRELFWDRSSCLPRATILRVIFF